MILVSPIFSPRERNQSLHRALRPTGNQARSGGHHLERATVAGEATGCTHGKEPFRLEVAAGMVAGVATDQHGQAREVTLLCYKFENMFQDGMPLERHNHFP